MQQYCNFLESRVIWAFRYRFWVNLFVSIREHNRKITKLRTNQQYSTLSLWVVDFFFFRYNNMNKNNNNNISNNQINMSCSVRNSKKKKNNPKKPNILKSMWIFVWYRSIIQFGRLIESVCVAFRFCQIFPVIVTHALNVVAMHKKNIIVKKYIYGILFVRMILFFDLRRCNW